MIQLLNTLLIGITSGGIYALMAISMVLVWRSTRVINFAQAGMALLWLGDMIGDSLMPILNNLIR